ncbi:proteoglycan 4-like [Penaeus monodon]|uniref:proteoglycan 4-like n=1 Tax=Penaeus monodon TaxID=6687 RepID=UPI0018A76932|nr:proteoglycan 4-like [Penaeus monodon]
MVSLEDYPADGPLVGGDEEEDVAYVIEGDGDEAANKTDGEKDGVVEAQPDYIYDHKPEDDYENIVEYEQEKREEENGTLSESSEAPATGIPLAYEAIPSALLATAAEKKAPGDRLPVPLDDFDPADIVVEGDAMAGDDLLDRMVGDDSFAAYDLMDRMVGDDPSVYAANGKPKRKLFRSWMAAFPTLEPPAGGAEGADEKDGEGKQAPTAPAPALTSTAEPVIGKSLIWRRPMAPSVDTWFSRYGRSSAASRDADANDPASGDFEDELQMRITRRSGGRGSVQWTSFDPRDPNGGPIPQSDPSHFPSKILESLGVTQRTRDSRNPEPKLAKELFPHIFEYDLDDHDDYYYDEPVYYYDDATEHDKRYRKAKDRNLDDANDEDDSADVILDDDLGEARPGYRDPKSIVTLRPAPVRSQLRPTGAPVSATQYPPGLRVMSLTKEEFHVALPEPRVETLRDGRHEVVEIEVVPLSSRDAPRSASPSFNSGPDYSQAHHTRYQTTTTTTTTTTTPTTTTTTTTTTPPPPPPPPPTRPPTESPPPTKPPAKFLPTRPAPEPRQVQFAVAADSASVPRSKQGNIPKFLIHKTEEQYDYLRSAGVVHYHPLTSAPLDAAAAHRPPPVVMTSDQPYAEAEPDRRNYYRDEADDLPKAGAAAGGAHSPAAHSPAAHSPAAAHRAWSPQPSQSEASRAEEQPASHDAAHDPSPILPAAHELLSDIEVIPRGRSLQAAAEAEQRALRSAQHHDASVPEVSPALHAFPPPARNSKRVTVNVTIATEDETKAEAGPSGSSKPLYVLSVSVPTSSQDQKADINIVKPDNQEQIATLTVNVRGNTTYDDSRQHETRPEAFQAGVPERLVSPSGRAGQCQCPCPCSPASNSIPIPASFLANAGNKIQDHTQYRKDPTHPHDSRP